VKQKPASYESEELRRFGETLRGRRTIELFLQTPVPKQLVLDAIESATWAPNHHVTEPWHFYLLGPEAVEACLDLNEALVTAKKGPEAAAFKRRSWSEKPGWMVLTCHRSDDQLRQSEDYAACAAALQNFCLYLWKAGVGTKWTTGDITRDPAFADILGIDYADEFVVGLVWYGYPKLTPTQSRKGPDDVVSDLP
jgi:nitroreductase